MKNKERYVWMVITGVLFVVIIMLRSCNDVQVPFFKKCPPVVKCPELDTTDTYAAVWDSLQKRIVFLEDEAAKPKRVIHNDVVLPFGLEKTDTAAIIAWYEKQLDDCAEERQYEFPYRDDSLSATLNIDVAFNKAKRATLDYKFLFPVGHAEKDVSVTYDTTVVRGYGSALTFGGGIEAGANGLYFAGIGLGISTNKGSHIAVDYNAYKLLTGEDKYSFRLGYHQAIRFKKR